MKIRNLKKTLRDFTLSIDSLDLEIPRTYGLLGANGCGKSTFLKLISGILKSDSGTIDYEGISNRELTLVPQKPYLMKDTVENNLLYPLKIRNIHNTNDALEGFIDLAGLQSLRKGYAPNLSSGEAQRLSLARGLIFSPKLILIDEVFSNMDVESQISFENYILSNRGGSRTTYIIISHQLAVIKRLCEQTIFMDNGRILAFGPTEEMLNNPTHPTLKNYISFLEGGTIS